MRLFPALLLLLTATTAYAQWDLEDPPTTADLRGVYNVGAGIVWASGTHGTVVRSEDGGYLWQACSIPPGAENLDFRGIQAFDENTAIVMSSGKGDLSRLYKTTDGCHSWKLIMTNEQPQGFWDSLKMWTPNDGFLAGDPVDGHLFLAESTSYWGSFLGDVSYLLKVKAVGESAFAASNSSLALGNFSTKNGESRDVWFGTGGASGSRVIHFQHFNGGDPERQSVSISEISSFPRSASGGIFALYFEVNRMGVAVGGDYLKPSETTGTASFTLDEGKTWHPAKTPPHGYRSAVAYDPDHKLWITVGPNGTDISTDDGKNWRALKPLKDQAPDTDQHWNALSLPFVVGPKGRIGKLNANALTPPKS